ncbi:MAG: hypothetical protein AAFU56_10710, partial [Pseudomonadota bacterium]
FKILADLGLVGFWLQGAVTFQKYWIRPDSGFISKSETRSKTSGGDFYTLQIIEKAPDWTLPSVE